MDSSREMQAQLEEMGLSCYEEALNDENLTNFIKTIRKKRVPINKHGGKILQAFRLQVNKEKSPKKSLTYPSVFEYNKATRQRNRAIIEKQKRALNSVNIKTEESLGGWQEESHTHLMDSDLFHKQ